MKKITIIIPSCSTGRIPLLIKTVESIQAGSYKNIHPVIVADGNPYIAEVANKQLHNVSIISNKERRDWIYSINRVLKEFDSEYYIFASDDLEFPHDCITHAMAIMNKRFPDGFGVVSIGKKTKCAFGLFGRKWAERFPDRQVFCPDLIHYGGDTELFRAIIKMGLFAYAPQRASQVKHFRLKDETWKLARRTRTRDRKITQQRLDQGYIWGIDFNLITKQ